MLTLLQGWSTYTAKQRRKAREGTAGGRFADGQIAPVPQQSQGRPTKPAEIDYLDDKTAELSSCGGLLPFASVC
jgi:hypothetical protein